MSTGYNHSDTIISWVYIIGILAAISVSAAPYAFPAFPQLKNVNIEEIYRYIRIGFFVGSISHVIVLAILGVTLKAVDKGLAGAKVGSAGYLHTLISFVTIFSQVKSNFSIESALYPVGAALVTSILGWFLGGEIAARKGTKTQSIQNESDKLASELEGFGKAIHKIHEEYVTTLYKANTEFSSLHTQQADMYKKVNKLTENADELVKSLQIASEKMTINLGDNFAKAVTSIADNFTKLTKEVEKSTAAAQNVAKYLDQSQVLIKQLEALFELIQKQSDTYAE